LGGLYDYAWGWIFFTVPFAGSIVGLLLFEFIHKSMSNAVPDAQRAQEVLAQKEDIPEEEVRITGRGNVRMYVSRVA